MFDLIDRNCDRALSRAEVIRAVRGDAEVRRLLGLPAPRPLSPTASPASCDDVGHHAFEFVFQGICHGNSREVSCPEFCEELRRRWKLRWKLAFRGWKGASGDAAALPPLPGASELIDHLCRRRGYDALCAYAASRRAIAAYAAGAAGARAAPSPLPGREGGSPLREALQAQDGGSRQSAAALRDPYTASAAAASDTRWQASLRMDSSAVRVGAVLGAGGCYRSCSGTPQSDAVAPLPRLAAGCVSLRVASAAAVARRHFADASKRLAEERVAAAMRRGEVDVAAMSLRGSGVDAAAAAAADAGDDSGVAPPQPDSQQTLVQLIAEDDASDLSPLSPSAPRHSVPRQDPAPPRSMSMSRRDRHRYYP